MGGVEDGRMHMTRHTADDLLDVVRVLLLVQAAILVATTIEAFLWSIAFAGAAGPAFLVTATMALTLAVARARLGTDRRWTKRLVYIIEGVLLVTLAIDTAIAIGLTGTVPPVVAVLTRFVLPLSVIALLRRASRPASTSVVPSTSALAEAS
jgi:hypothetical protein